MNVEFDYKGAVNTRRNTMAEEKKELQKEETLAKY